MAKDVTLDELNAGCDAFLARFREIRRSGMERPKAALALIGERKLYPSQVGSARGGGNLLAVRAGAGRKR